MSPVTLFSRAVEHSLGKGEVDSSIPSVAWWIKLGKADPAMA
jgi:hypothetical protein